jgi:hypothetical protein
MTLAGASYSGDSLGVPRCREPVMDGGANLASLNRWFAWASMSGD